ncbi:hypothetical protein I6Y99_003337 [Vibrio parahaemolyticus]|uniref:Uncharacterized protein n=1 Tax=Vibrio parahaemolyticus TaxID=670 RepID=A0A7Y0S4V0_VIBPH|nr:hypothetical protein [Vibrio parahaemolyticus]HDY7702284.1 hypothetical protein [Vibrio vulnificus]AKU57590.1 Phage protein [Vibrio parahaemolyticus]APE86649.1 Phage protein [Vibrio parahaemolyticus]EGQ7792752.1 hypothetical protein [Vibrio parahaemolyticus]EGQ7809352.1 hypothetical protein [Vibrio parahaemolyticus]
MQTYVAVQLNNGGGVVRHETTAEVMNLCLGEFETFEDAIQTACAQLGCQHVMSGVLLRGNHTGGHMVVTTQELREL